MENEDTIHLLKECDAGTKMAVSSINEVLERAQSVTLKNLLSESREHHEKLGNDIHELLIQYHSEEKDPNPIAKSMAWIKTNVKMEMDNCDASIADLITDGCNMGVKSLYKYLNQYPAANESTKELCHRLVSIEEELAKELRKYL